MSSQATLYTEKADKITVRGNYMTILTFILYCYCCVTAGCAGFLRGYGLLSGVPLLPKCADSEAFRIRIRQSSVGI